MSQNKHHPDELRARFTVYIERVILHARLDYIRKKRKNPQEISLEELDFEPETTFERQYATQRKPMDGFSFEEEKLAQAFSSLPLMRQKVLEMLFVENLSPIEISRRLHCSVKYVYDQRYLALQKLRRILKEGGSNDK